MYTLARSPLFLTAVLMLLAAGSATGAAPKAFGDFKAWQAVTSMTEDRKKSCYIVSRPVKSVPESAVRGDIYFMVTRESGNNRDKVSLRVGYPFKEDTTATVRIGSQVFRLNTGDKYAWPPGEKTAKRLVKAMRGGRDMTVKGESTRGTKTTDTFSLLGFTAGHKAISKACK